VWADEAPSVAVSETPAAREDESANGDGASA
jgi:hypothetical protein